MRTFAAGSAALLLMCATADAAQAGTANFEQESAGVFTSVLHVVVRWIFPLCAAYCFLAGVIGRGVKRGEWDLAAISVIASVGLALFPKLLTSLQGAAVSRLWLAILLGLGVQTGLAGAAAARDLIPGCDACRVGGMPWGIAGAIFYLLLFVAAMLRGPSRLVTGSLVFAAGIHGTLAGRLLWEGRACALCFAAGAASLVLAALVLRFDPRERWRATGLLPWGALLALFAQGLPDLPTAPGDPIRLVVYTQPDCRYCDDFRARMAPTLEREFGSRLELVYRPASGAPSVRRTPTFHIAPGGARRGSRVIEGLPSLEALRAAIRDVEVNL
jgi:hypothetical protein